jgi:serine/threonine protein kinase
MNSSGDSPKVMTQRVFTPQMFGRYCLIDQISKGGMSDIYLAKISGFGGFAKPVVVKKLQPKYSSKPRYVRRFINEANTLARLNHTNIVQVLDMGTIAGEYFIAMEYIEGRNAAYVLLKAAKTGSEPSLAFTTHMICELARGLAYSHRKKGPEGQDLRLVHQDVNSFNVMVSYEADVKIIDFGIAQIFLNKSGNEDLPVTGKLLYFSPEQLLKKPLDQRVDIYGTGALLYEFLTGERLVQHRKTVEETVRTILELDVEEKIRNNDRIPSEIRPILSKALAFDPENRYLWIEEMIADLRSVMKKMNLEVNVTEFSSYLRSLFQREILLDQRRMRKLLSVDVPGATLATLSGPPKQPQVSVGKADGAVFGPLSASSWPFDDSGTPTDRTIGFVAKTVCFRNGTLIFAQGDTGNEIYVIQKGKVRLFLGSGHNRHTIAIVREGDFFGEAILLDERRRTVSARAEADCQLLCLEKEDFLRLTSKDLPQRIILNLAERLSEATSLLECTSHEDTLSRLIYALLLRMRRGAYRNGTDIDVAELKDQFRIDDGSLMEKYLKKLESLEVVKTGKKSVQIKDGEKLQQILDILSRRGRHLIDL